MTEMAIAGNNENAIKIKKNMYTGIALCQIHDRAFFEIKQKDSDSLRNRQTIDWLRNTYKSENTP